MARSLRASAEWSTAYSCRVSSEPISGSPLSMPPQATSAVARGSQAYWETGFVLGFSQTFLVASEAARQARGASARSGGAEGEGVLEAHAGGVEGGQPVHHQQVGGGLVREAHDGEVGGEEGLAQA